MLYECINRMCEFSNDLLLTAFKIIIVCGGNICVCMRYGAVPKEIFHWHKFHTEIFLGQWYFIIIECYGVKSLEKFKSFVLAH